MDHFQISVMSIHSIVDCEAITKAHLFYYTVTWQLTAGDLRIRCFISQFVEQDSSRNQLYTHERMHRH